MFPNSSSAGSRYILVLFEQYGQPKKCAQKVLVTLLPYLFHIKTKWHSLQILKNRNLFNRHKYPSPNALNIKFLNPQLQPLGGLGYH